MAARNAVTRNLVGEFQDRLAQARREIYATIAMTDDELEGRERHALDEIDAARARLAAGTYGVREHCVRAIPLERLRAVPTTRCCVACQHREER